MKTLSKIAILSFLTIFVMSCSSGYKAYKHGDYYKACMDAVDKLRTSPRSDKAQYVLQKTYPLAQQTALREIENALLRNDQNNYETVVYHYERLNELADNIYACPKANQLIPNPKQYPAELADAKQKAAAQIYELATKALNAGSLEQARLAYQYFQKANNYVYGYKDALNMIEEARFQATMRVVVEKPRTSMSYQLSADFFSENLMTEISQYFANRFVRFYNAYELSNNNSIRPHQYLVLNFEDFSIGNTSDTKNTVELTRDSVFMGTATVNGKKVNVYNTVKAKYSTYRREILSRGILSVRIYDNNNVLIQQRNFAGQYVWYTTWASFNGDERALTTEQRKLCDVSPQIPPSHQQMFVEFTKPIYSQAYSYIRSYYNKY